MGSTVSVGPRAPLIRGMPSWAPVDGPCTPPHNGRVRQQISVATSADGTRITWARHGSEAALPFPAGAEDRLVFMISLFRTAPTHASQTDP